MGHGPATDLPPAGWFPEYGAAAKKGHDHRTRR